MVEFLLGLYSARRYNKKSHHRRMLKFQHFTFSNIWPEGERTNKRLKFFHQNRKRLQKWWSFEPRTCQFTAKPYFVQGSGAKPEFSLILLGNPRYIVL